MALVMGRFGITLWENEEEWVKEWMHVSENRVPRNFEIDAHTKEIVNYKLAMKDNYIPIHQKG